MTLQDKVIFISALSWRRFDNFVLSKYKKSRPESRGGFEAGEVQTASGIGKRERYGSMSWSALWRGSLTSISLVEKSEIDLIPSGREMSMESSTHDSPIR